MSYCNKIYFPNEPVVIIDKDYYDDLKRQAELKEAEINQKAKEKANDYLLTEGVKFTIEINNPHKVFRGQELIQVVEDEYNIYCSDDPITKKMRYRLVNDILDEVNQRLRSYRKETVDTFLELFKKERIAYRKKIRKD